MQAGVKSLFFIAVLPVALLATSAVTLRFGPAHRAVIRPEEDCHFEDKTVQAIRIERAILDDDGKETGRAVVGSCSKTKLTEDYWTYTLDERGKVQSKQNTTVRFDDRGQFIEQANRTWGDDGQEDLMQFQTTYDPQGRPSVERTIDDSGAHAVRYTYNDVGDQVTVTRFDQDGKVESVDTLRYDDEHHLIEKIPQDGVATSYRYDAQGQLSEEIFHSGGGEQNAVVYAYDAQGRQLSKRSLAGPARAVVTINGFSYWPNGLIKGEWLLRPTTAPPSYDPPGLTFEHWAYDEHNHLAEEWAYSQTRDELPKRFVVLVDDQLETFGTSNGLRSYAYTYDSHGNWVKAVETQLSDNDDPGSGREVTAITYRQIAYR
jgi:YD repeat-containing protein